MLFIKFGTMQRGKESLGIAQAFFFVYIYTWKYWKDCLCVCFAYKIHMLNKYYSQQLSCNIIEVDDMWKWIGEEFTFTKSRSTTVSSESHDLCGSKQTSQGFPSWSIQRQGLKMNLSAILWRFSSLLKTFILF